MDRIRNTFARLKKDGKKAFIAYITAGDPSLRSTEKLAIELEKSGVDIIEFGIPFSDPLADGPTIQKASQRAIARGGNLRSILKLVCSVRKKVSIPIIFMTYYNIVANYGARNFVIDSKKAGADGVIVPDLPPEEASELIRFSEENRFALIFLAAPTSTDSRLKMIAKRSKGFIYYVSLTGVTGARRKLPKDLIRHVKKLKRYTDKPVCVGFGISSTVQAAQIAKVADGVIVGSAIIKIIESNLKSGHLYKRVSRFVKGLARAVHGK